MNDFSDQRGALHKFLEPYRWQLFGTLRSAQERSDSSHWSLMNSFISRFQKAEHGRVAWVAALEKRSRYGGISTPHIHAVIISHKPLLHPDIAVAAWSEANRVRAVAEPVEAGRFRAEGGLADISVYDRNRAGLDYLLKHINSDPTSWAFSHNLIRFALA